MGAGYGGKWNDDIIIGKSEVDMIPVSMADLVLKHVFIFTLVYFIIKVKRGHYQLGLELVRTLRMSSLHLLSVCQ